MVKLIMKNSLQWWHQNNSESFIITNYINLFLFVCFLSFLSSLLYTCVLFSFFSFVYFILRSSFFSKTIYYTSLFFRHKYTHKTHTHTHILAYYNTFFLFQIVSTFFLFFTWFICISNFSAKESLYYIYIRTPVIVFFIYFLDTSKSISINIRRKVKYSW